MAVIVGWSGLARDMQCLLMTHTSRLFDNRDCMIDQTAHKAVPGGGRAPPPRLGFDSPVVLSLELPSGGTHPLGHACPATRVLPVAWSVLH